MELGGAEQSESKHKILEGTRTSRSPKTFSRVRPWLDKPCPASRKGPIRSIVHDARPRPCQLTDRSARLGRRRERQGDFCSLREG